MEMLSLADIVGFIGVVIYVGSFALLNLKRIDGNGALYITLNMLAAICVLISLSESFNGPSFAIQSIWVGLSLFGLWRLRGKEKKQLTEVVEKTAALKLNNIDDINKKAVD